MSSEAQKRARHERALLGAWLAGLFALSALTSLLPLAVVTLALLAILARGALGHARRAALVTLPFTLGLALAAALFAFGTNGAMPDPAALLALALRAFAMAFVSFAVLARVRLLAALAPWPAATRLLAVTLAEVHALRLLAVDARQALLSRMPRRPRAREVVQSAAPLSATLLDLSLHNAREVTEALRARGADV